ncbi:MAG: DUF4197 domain-containing protein [Bacteroidota bacterium]
MKTFRYLLVLVFVGFSFSCQKDTGLTNEQIVAGLKEALKVGATNSTTQAHATDGYFLNSLIKIPWPQDAEFVKVAVSAIPIIGQPLVDELVLKVNRAAEDAADKALPIFVDAITNINFSDALGILNGADDAATQYLKTNTSAGLKTAFKPNIQTSLTSVGAQQAWNNVTSTYNSTIPSPQPINTDLADYTTGKAIDGLFVLVAKEEYKIRTDINARVSDILKQVFGNK